MNLRNIRVFFLAITAVAVTLGFSSCNSKIDNPKQSNFIGTWQLKKMEAILAGRVNQDLPIHGDIHVIITEETMSYWSGKQLSWESAFRYENKKIYLDGSPAYDVVSLTSNEMVLSARAVIRYDSYKYYYQRQ
jgi:hypothetical protein